MPLRQLHSLATDMGHVELILPRSPMYTPGKRAGPAVSGAAQPEHGLPEESLDRLCNHARHACVLTACQKSRTVQIGTIAPDAVPRYKSVTLLHT